MNVQQDITPWGNSAGIRLPKRVREEANLKLHQSLDITVRGNSIVLTPAKQTKKVRLEDLLKGVTPENIHGEVDFGPPVGKELI